MERFTKQRPRPEPGSIPALLAMFEREVRFYREIAPEVGVRVPGCHEATATEDGYRLMLEDLSSWREGGDPVEVAKVLAGLHCRWEGIADQQWPWLPRAGKAAAEIGDLYDRVWARVRRRIDVTGAVREVGDRYVGKVAALERQEGAFGRRTLIHGDPSLRNTRSSVDGVIAFVDWEDVRSASGTIDLTWLLISSVEPNHWDEVIDAYEPDEGEFEAALPYAVTQGILTLADHQPGSRASDGWSARIDAAARRLQ